MIITKELAYQIKVLCDTATTDESRPVLTTVNIEVEAERAFFVAADGFRLSAVCLPIKTDTKDDFTLQVDAKMLKKLLKAKSTLSITPTSLDIDGVSLPALNVGLYPHWRSLIPHNTEPKANIAAFSAEYSQEFLKFRWGREHKGTNYGITSFAAMHYSVYDDDDKCGMTGPSCWAWQEWYDGDEKVQYLHILMPINAMVTAPVYSLAEDEVTEEKREAFTVGNLRLAELLLERFGTKITEITGPLPELWRETKNRK